MTAGSGLLESLFEQTLCHSPSSENKGGIAIHGYRELAEQGEFGGSGDSGESGDSDQALAELELAFVDF